MFEQYKKEKSSALTPSLVAEIKDYFQTYVQSKLISASATLKALVSSPVTLEKWDTVVTAVNGNQQKIGEEVGEKFPMYWQLVQNVHAAITHATECLEKGQECGQAAAEELIQVSKDIVAEAVDKKVNPRTSEIVHDSPDCIAGSLRLGAQDFPRFGFALGTRVYEGHESP